MSKFKPGDYVKSDRFRGIAMYVHGNAVRTVWNEEEQWCESDGHYDDIYECVMIGDDEGHNIHEDDLELLNRDEFCAECGQIGCGHNVLEME